jgi:hypothetical protein
MKKLILLLFVFLFSCTKEDIPTRQVFNFKKPINSVTLSTDSLNRYYSNRDWLSVSTKRTYNVTTDFNHVDSLGTLFNLTSIIKRNQESFMVTYELGSQSKSTVNVMDKPLGLMFLLNTTTNEFDTLKVKLFQDGVLVYQYYFPYIVSTP